MKKPNKPSKLPSVPRIKRPALPHAVSKRIAKRRAGKGPLETLSGLPRITNETVAEHREEILGSARKYIYPLQHSRDRILKISAMLLVAAVVAFFTYCGLALYKFQSTNTFIYEVTRVIPFPVAKAGSHYVSYESYLFELRHLTHYYETQQNENFKNSSNTSHLVQLKKDSLQKVIDDAYVKELADKNNITVSNREVADQINLVKSQNRLGSNDQMLSDVLKQFWGWSIEDFQRELKSQLLSQKVASTLDTETHTRATAALDQIRSGADFGTVAAKYSDDATTKDKAGAYPAAVSVSSHDLPPRIIEALFKLQPGQVSEVIDNGYSLEIVKSLSEADSKIQGAHVSFKLQSISTYIQPLKDQEKTHRLIKV